MRKKNSKTNKKQKPIDLTQPIETHSFGFKNRLKARTENQKAYINTVSENIITFCQGLAGSGKTHIAIGMALEHLLINDKVKKIIITRPVIEAGEKIGYLPGTAEEKLHPYLLPIIDEIHHFISPAYHASLRINNKIEVIPLGLMRGRNFHNSFIVADECQNASYEQLKMLLTRVGQESKLVLTGDIGQSDLNWNMQGGFSDLISALDGLKNIGFAKLEYSDIVRNPIIADILARLTDHERRK